MARRADHVEDDFRAFRAADALDDLRERQMGDVLDRAVALADADNLVIFHEADIARVARARAARNDFNDLGGAVLG